jgi:hypothetical protein
MAGGSESESFDEVPGDELPGRCRENCKAERQELWRKLYRFATAKYSAPVYIL